MEWLAGIDLESLANALVILIVGLAAGLGFKRGKSAPEPTNRAGLEVATDFFDSQAIKCLTTEVTGQAYATTESAMAVRDQAAATRALTAAVDAHTRAVIDHKEEVQELRHEMSRRR
ncbi:hypothetical protein VQ042_11490 [Aurantimonas sp. A2-1-M11]|uniref:hypothetical protein n=1 Tax=Aurantimonas sp. A2-1-M11 TaxID=3113712 RepID=UPI002F923E2D